MEMLVLLPICAVALMSFGVIFGVGGWHNFEMNNNIGCTFKSLQFQDVRFSCLDV